MSSHTVLLVDSDRDSLSIYRTMLEHHGVQVRIALDGHEALRIARTERPHLIVTEVLLSGPQPHFTTHLKQDDETGKIPVLVISSVVPRSWGARDQVVYDEYLSKPCSPTRMLKEVQRFLSEYPSQSVPAA